MIAAQKSLDTQDGDVAAVKRALGRVSSPAIPDQERMMAKRAKAKTVEVKSSHVAYISHPKETAKLIEEAATSVGR